MGGLVARMNDPLDVYSWEMGWTGDVNGFGQGEPLANFFLGWDLGFFLFFFGGGGQIACMLTVVQVKHHYSLSSVIMC